MSPFCSASCAAAGSDGGEVCTAGAFGSGIGNEHSQAGQGSSAVCEADACALGLDFDDVEGDACGGDAGERFVWVCGRTGILSRKLAMSHNRNLIILYAYRPP